MLAMEMRSQLHYILKFKFILCNKINWLTS